MASFELTSISMGSLELTSLPQPRPTLQAEPKIDPLDQLFWTPRSHPPTPAMVRRMLNYSNPWGETAASRLRRRIQYRLWDRLNSQPRKRRRK